MRTVVEEVAASMRSEGARKFEHAIETLGNRLKDDKSLMQLYKLDESDFANDHIGENLDAVRTRTTQTSILEMIPLTQL
jgi:uncharacterized membrane protein YgaE (UPF0421/DUF939 family)